MKTSRLLLLVTTLFTGLMAGLFYAYSCSVIPGLGKLGNSEYLKAMQSINREIQNPVFFVCFFGVPILFLICLYRFYGQRFTGVFLRLSFAALAYYIGVFGVTVFGNLPLNNTLDQFDIAHATTETLRMQRDHFETTWNILNHIRTSSAIISLLLMLFAMARKMD